MNKNLDSLQRAVNELNELLKKYELADLYEIRLSKRGYRAYKVNSPHIFLNIDEVQSLVYRIMSIYDETVQPIDKIDKNTQLFNEIAKNVKNMIGDDKWEFVMDYIRTMVTKERDEYDAEVHAGEDW